MTNASNLKLKDGSLYEGVHFGALTSVSGEVVFTTGMVGYPEALTDPSFRGQILILTFPLVGNYGIPEPKLWESKRPQISGLIVCNYINTPSHHASMETLGAWLKRYNIPALEIKDTRALTQKLRTEGVMLGIMKCGSNPMRLEDPNDRNLVAEVSTNDMWSEGEGKKTVVVIDYYQALFFF